MALSFTPSEPLTLGVEMEVQIIDAESRDLTPGAPQLLARLGGPRPTIKPEIFQAMLEVCTGVCRNVAEVQRELESALAEVRAAADALGFRLASAGSHPFARHRERLVSPGDRYQGLIDRNRWLARRLMVFGLHVHVGMRSGEHAQAVINGMLPYLPHLLALSASSPFWQGSDTGLASSRITIFEALPTAGHPCTFRDWQDFEAVYDAMRRSGAIRSIKDVWWDIRPHPDFGTIELRVCDGLPTLRETIALVGVMHSLCAWLDARYADGERPQPPSMWTLRENKWRASRWGFDAEVILADDGRTRPLREELGELFGHLAPWAARCGAGPALATAAEMLAQPPSYERQRALFARHGSLVPVTDALIAELASDRPVLGT
jgi:carboxylate-amine ligase